MTFQKYSLKTQIILALIFTPLNFSTAILNSQILHLPVFLDMIFVYAASFFGIPCGIITGILHTSLVNLIFEKNPFHLLFSICCITGTFFTWLLITRHNNSSWVRVALLIFISTVVISLEGSLIYSIFLSTDTNYSEEETILFLVYNLVRQNISLQMSAFLARLPVNLIDKTIAVLGGFGVYKLISIGQKTFFSSKQAE